MRTSRMEARTVRRLAAALAVGVRIAAVLLSAMVVPAALVSLAGCGDDATQPREPDPFTLSWTSDSTGMASLLYGEPDQSPSRIAYEAATVPGQHHVVKPLGVRGQRSHVGRWRLRLASGEILEEEPFFFEPEDPVPGLLSFTMIDIGWGDAHLITTPSAGESDAEGAWVLIDAGRPDHALDLVHFLEAAGFSPAHGLTGIVLTHPDCDHLGGFVGTLADTSDGVLERFPVQWALESTGVEGSDSLYARFRELLESRGVSRHELPDGATSESEPLLLWDPDLTLRALNSGNQIGLPPTNNASIVLKLTLGDFSLLTGGDALVPVEERMLERYGGTLRSEVLKVHHHGNADASAEEFLRAVEPRAALIPIAESEVLVSPAASVLLRLRQLGIDIFRSDRIDPIGLDGGFHVTVLSDGNSFEVAWERSSTAHAFHPDCAP